MSVISQFFPCFFSAPIISQNESRAAPLSVDELTRKVVETLQASQIPERKVELTHHFETITPNQLSHVLDSVIENFSRELLGTEDLVTIMNQLAEILPFEKLKLVNTLENLNPLDALKNAQEMFQEAKHYLKKTDSSISQSLSSTLSSMCDAILSAIENILAAFGLAQFFKSAENDSDAESRGQKLMMLLSFFSVLSASLLPLLGEALAGLIIGGSLLLISVLSVIYPYFRPAPTTIPKGDNWSRQIQQGQLLAPEGRKKILDQLAHDLITNTGREHPMLIGDSKTGKTETVKALTQAIERGDYPELQGKQVIYFGTADLVQHVDWGGGNRILTQISDAMGSHQDKFILIFDETHVACQKNEHSDIGEQLKIKLQSGKFPHVIGITTPEGYQEILTNNPAFATRFHPIPFDSTDSIETLEILNNTLLRKAPEVLLGDNALEHIWEKTNAIFSGKPQPATSLEILSNCIQRTAKSQKSPLEEKIEKIYGEITALHSQGATKQIRMRLGISERKRKQAIQTLKEQLEPLEAQLKQETLDRARFFKVRDKLAEVKTAMFRMILKVSTLQPNALSEKEKSEVMALLLLRNLLAPRMEDYIAGQAEKLKLNTVVDANLIDAVIEKLQENDKKIQAFKGPAPAPRRRVANRR